MGLMAYFEVQERLQVQSFDGEVEELPERYESVAEYDAVLRWHCRLDESAGPRRPKALMERVEWERERSATLRKMAVDQREPGERWPVPRQLLEL
jgi:hypothetical protein